MSETSSRNPVAPVERKDIRADNLAFKHDKDRREKWSNGIRIPCGTRLDPVTDEIVASNESQKIRVRPHKQWSQMSGEHKSHANKPPKPYGSYDGRSRLAHKNAAIVEAKESGSNLSKSLLELLPTHSNNTESAIQIALRESAAFGQADILYSFDNKGPSPGDKGRPVDLGGLVDLAEQRFRSDQTDRIVKGEYEVLDHDGETTVIGRGKGRKSPKHKAAKRVVRASNSTVMEDDDFEFIERDI
ncbi:hypothetical protein LZ554_005696 [Drepanopeziza brunnea f. sp. 'monogermtubi']|nr:hypothetical protein LZ554_005696 [Drepanopeziza brunnea f. sp. 'monogermtubi']